MVSESTKFFRTIALFIVLTAVAYVATGLLVGKSDAAVQADPPMGVCFTTVPEYAAFYVGSYGYAYYANIPVKVRVCGYTPAQMTQLNWQIVTGVVRPY